VEQPTADRPQRRPASTGHGTALLVLFGSNLGTAEGIANRLGREGVERGYQVTVAALDDHGTELPTQGAVLIVCSSYNGEPPENATAFVGRLGEEALAADAFAGVAYTVFGCGDTDWAATYQAVPKLLDKGLERHGARGFIRAARGMRTPISTASTERGTQNCGPTSRPHFSSRPSRPRGRRRVRGCPSRSSTDY